MTDAERKLLLRIAEFIAHSGIGDASAWSLESLHDAIVAVQREQARDADENAR